MEFLVNSTNRFGWNYVDRSLLVSPAALAAMQTGVGLSSGQPGDDTLNPAADEARDHLARTVAQCGDDIEQIIVTRNPDDPNLWFLKDKTSSAYRQYRNLVEKYRYEIKYNEDEEFLKKVVKDERVIVEDEAGEYGPQAFQERMLAVKTEMDNKGDFKRSGDDSDEGQASAARRRKRRSRWAPESEKVNVIPPGTTGAIPITSNVGGIQQAGAFPAGGPPAANIPFLSKLTRTDPALVQYAIQAFGSSNLSEEDWKKAEDHYKINLLYQDMLRKRQELERLQRAGKFKYEYDSDEETDGGTWEHRLRMQEMEATQRWAEELTKKAEGKHHIGDFLPPDELERFLEKYSALKEGREPDLSDYKEFKLKEDNIGFQMLQKLGWTEGQGLGSDGHGIVDPVNKASSRPDNQGLGVERPEDVSRGDDEYDAYRKRMMLAYRFRPNPLNNPRRPYY
ncbi:SURP and G-patch domain-containing protein 1 [Blattella germanica]|nr:SURP and G-patch domain-containing protein 1 [Blattella germanica]